MSDVHPATPVGSPPPPYAPGSMERPDGLLEERDEARRQLAAMTSGQAAYEASVLVMADDFEYPPWRWDQLPKKHRDSWDAAAQAAVTAGTGRILAEAARYKAERDELDAAYKKLDAQCEVHWLARQSAESRLEVVTAERDKLAEGLDMYRKALDKHDRSLYAAQIDIHRKDYAGAAEIIGERLDGWDDGPEWNGTETGTEWLERTRETDESTPEAQS